jgi:hypothetical protein
LGSNKKRIVVGLMAIIDWMFKIFQAARNFVLGGLKKFGCRLWRLKIFNHPIE